MMAENIMIQFEFASVRYDNIICWLQFHLGHVYRLSSLDARMIRKFKPRNIISFRENSKSERRLVVRINL